MIKMNLSREQFLAVIANNEYARPFSRDAQVAITDLIEDLQLNEPDPVNPLDIFQSANEVHLWVDVPMDVRGRAQGLANGHWLWFD